MRREMESAPGAVAIIDPAHAAGISFSTHALPMSVLCNYLTRETGAVVMLVGIQPATVKFGDAVTEEVRRAAEMVAEQVVEMVADL